MDVPLTPLERARMLAPKERARQELEAELVAALDAYEAQPSPSLSLRSMTLRMHPELGGFADGPPLRLVVPSPDQQENHQIDRDPQGYGCSDVGEHGRSLPHRPDVLYP